MTVTKHYENDHVVLYVDDGDIKTCITLDSDRQMKWLGQCLINLERTGGRKVSIETREGEAVREG